MMWNKYALIPWLLAAALIIAVVYQQQTINEQDKWLDQQLKENEKLKKVIQKIDSAIQDHQITYDSLQIKRNELDENVLNLPADSIIKLWADRFGNH